MSMRDAQKYARTQVADRYNDVHREINHTARGYDNLLSKAELARREKLRAELAAIEDLQQKRGKAIVEPAEKLRIELNDARRAALDRIFSAGSAAEAVAAAQGFRSAVVRIRVDLALVKQKAVRK